MKSVDVKVRKLNTEDFKDLLESIQDGEMHIIPLEDSEETKDGDDDELWNGSGVDPNG